MSLALKRLRNFVGNYGQPSRIEGNRATFGCSSELDVPPRFSQRLRTRQNISVLRKRCLFQRNRLNTRLRSRSTLKDIMTRISSISNESASAIYRRAGCRADFRLALVCRKASKHSSEANLLSPLQGKDSQMGDMYVQTTKMKYISG